MSANPLAPPWLIAPDDANALPPQVWPYGASRSSEGELVIAGLSASRIAADYGTPVYVIDEAEVRRRARSIRESFEREFGRVGTAARVYYAGKAFLSTEVARWVTESGLRIDVCSGGELAVVLAAGVDPELLGYHGNNKGWAEIDRAVSVGVGSIVIDSIPEIQQVADAASRHGRTQRVLVRINSGVHASTHEYLATAREDQKFGIALTEASDAVAIIRRTAGLELAGLHSHIGSQIFETDGFAEAARRLFALHAELGATESLGELNLGGGFGISYTSADDAPAVDELAARFADVIAAAAGAAGVPVPLISIEPGRSVIGPAGVTLYSVGTIKDVEIAVPGGTAARKYVSVDGGMSDNIRPALYGAQYSARIANRASGAQPVLVRVVGKHCESGDVVVNSEYLPGDVAAGDLLAVPATGAYCFSLASNYNYLARPPVIAVRDSTARVIIRGETEADLLGRDVGVGT